jgi:hypothetical protein
MWLCTMLVHPFARADAVADWNRTALDTVIRSEPRAARQLDAMAIVNIAMLEALNFVRGHFRPRFVVASPGIEGVSLDAVAAAAAHHVLVNSYPSRKAALDAALGRSLEALPSDDAVRSGVILGASIAATVRAGTSADEAQPEDDAGEINQVAHLSPPGNALSWNALVSGLIASRSLAPDESARVHALASIAAAEALLAATHLPRRCAECIAAASVAYVLASELGGVTIETATSDSDREAGRGIARFVLGRYYGRVGKP